jgi:quinol monooxygenase YgiN
MAMISKSGATITLVNVFTVSHDNQQRLVDLLQQATDQVMKFLPGFLSANTHKSVDGVRVVTYAQWRSPEDVKAMLANPALNAHMESIGELAGFDAHRYVVADSPSGVPEAAYLKSDPIRLPTRRHATSAA